MTDTTTKYLPEIRAAIADEKYSHSRNRQWCGAEITYIYHRDPDSPTGVKLVAGGDAAIVEPLIQKMRKGGPLSPTEGLPRNA